MSEKENSINNSNEDYAVIDLFDLLTIYVRKWLSLCIISAVAAIAVFLIVNFFVNKSARRQTIGFELNYPDMETGLYPDGTSFVYQDFVSAGFLESVIKSDFSKYGHLDAKKLEKGKAIAISRVTNTTKDGAIELTNRFVLTIKPSYFNGSDEIESFINALSDVVKDKIKEASNSVYYKLYLDSFDNSDTFQNKLELLKTQKEYITNRYQTWIDVYGEQYSVLDVKLSRYLENANQAFSDKEFNSLNYELQKRQYVFNKGEDEELVCKLQIEILNDEFEDNEKKIKGLTEALDELRKGEKSSQGDISGKSNETYYYEQIATYTERQIDIEREISNLEIQIQNMSLVYETKKYNDKLIKVYDSLIKQTQTLEQIVSPAIYSEKTSVVFDSEGFKTSGTKSAPLFAVIAFVGTYFVAGFIMLVVAEEDKRKKSKKK